MNDALDQLRDGLHQAASGVHEADLLHGVLQRSASRRRRRRRTVAAGVTAVAVVLGGVTATQLAGRRPGVTQPAVPSTPRLEPPIAPFTSPARIAPPTGPRSQSEADAGRDNVPPEVARLPLSSRVDPIRSVTGASGRWTISRIPEPVAQRLLDAHMSVLPGGLSGRDFVSPMEYGELLLMDRAGTRIERAFPLHGVIPHGLLVTDAAVYVTRSGRPDTTDQMVGRYDLHTHTWRVRITPATFASHFSPHPDVYVPPQWQVGTHGLVREDPSHGTLTVTESLGGATVVFDPVTLGIVDVHGGHLVAR